MEKSDRGCKERSFASVNRQPYKSNLGFLFLAVTLFLSGCASVEPTYTVEVIPPKRPVLQQNLVSNCPDLPKLDKQWYTQAEVVDLLTDWISLYESCQYKHAELSKFITRMMRSPFCFIWMWLNMQRHTCSQYAISVFLREKSIVSPGLPSVP